MPRLLPPSPDWVEGRHGERAVWEALRDNLPDEAALLHSVWMVEDDREYAWARHVLSAVAATSGLAPATSSRRRRRTRRGS